MRPSRTLITTLAALAAWLALPRDGMATIPLQNQAKALAYPAEDCSYCHTFSREHMTEAARKAGLTTTNCITCHGNQLPLAGLELFNDRGRYLLAEKKKRKAEKPDAAWLKDYVEKEPEDDQPKNKPGH